MKYYNARQPINIYCVRKNNDLTKGKIVLFRIALVITFSNVLWKLISKSFFFF